MTAMKNAAVMVWKKEFTCSRVRFRRNRPVRTPQQPATIASAPDPPKNTAKAVEDAKYPSRRMGRE